jgi:hypothetical protein
MTRELPKIKLEALQNFWQQFCTDAQTKEYLNHNSNWQILEKNNSIFKRIPKTFAELIFKIDKNSKDPTEIKTKEFLITRIFTHNYILFQNSIPQIITPESIKKFFKPRIYDALEYETQLRKDWGRFSVKQPKLCEYAITLGNHYKQKSTEYEYLCKHTFAESYILFEEL